MLNYESLKEAASLIERTNRVLVVSHTHPDGDAIGALLAMKYILEQLGKEVELYSKDGVPDRFRFLQGWESIRNNLNKDEVYDLLVLVDCSSVERAGVELDGIAYSKVLLIDHHTAGSALDLTGLVDTSAASTTEIVFKLAKFLGVQFTKDIATCIFCGLYVDTGSFRHSNTSVDSFRLAADLVSMGVEPHQVASHIDESKSLQSMRLLSSMLSTLTVDLSGAYAYAVLTKEMFDQNSATLSDCEDFVDFPRSLSGVEVAALFREEGPNRWRVSLRSKSRVDVSSVAREFGGGGHVHAAGCTVELCLEDSKKAIRELISRALSGSA